MKRLSLIKRALKGPYLFSFIFIVLGYIILNMIINQVYVTGFGIFKAYSIAFLIPFIALHLIVATLVGLNVNLAIMKYKDLKAMQHTSATNKASGVAALGVFGGLLGGACPGCFVGLFPAVLGLFGISASLTVLPLYGLELQIGSAVILGVSLILLTRPMVCKIKKKKKKK